MKEKQKSPVADPEMSEVFRAIWGDFEKPWIRNKLRRLLPAMRMSSMGCEFEVHLQDNFTEQHMFENGVPPEHAATMEFARYFSDRNCTIVDVGANAGAFFLPILLAGSTQSKAVVFEPNPTMRARLARNVDLNDASDRVAILDCAAGDHEEKSHLFLPDNGNLGQGRVGLSYSEEEGVENAIAINVRPLADCLAEVNVSHIDLLKVDLDGQEDRVIYPLLESENAPRPRLIHLGVAHEGGWKYPLLETLAEAGYVEKARFGQNALYAKDVT